MDNKVQVRLDASEWKAWLGGRRQQEKYTMNKSKRARVLTIKISEQYSE